MSFFRAGCLAGGGRGTAVTGASARATAGLGEKSTKTGCRGGAPAGYSGGIRGGSSSSSITVETGMGGLAGTLDATPEVGETGDGLGGTAERVSFFTGTTEGGSGTTG